jgi:hypothetical protein
MSSPRSSEPRAAKMPNDRKSSGQPSGLETVAALTGLATISSALLYFFGWMRITAVSYQIGLPQDILSFGAYDYILRGVSSTVRPLGLIALLFFSTYTLHRAIWRQPLDPEVVRLERLALRLIELLALSVGLLIVLIFPDVERYSSIGLGIVLAGLLLRIVRRYSARSGNSPGRLEGVLLLATTIFVATWTTASYVGYLGKLDAQRFEDKLELGQDRRDIGELPSVTVYSKDDLDFSNNVGVQVDRLRVIHRPACRSAAR